MKLLILLLTIPLLFISCGEQQRSKANGTYICGEIVNPKSDYVILLHKDSILDSIKLDASNRFTYRNDSLKSELYTFWHNEYQTFYIEPNDSIVFRVNTIDFDESLHYSGTLADENNLMLTLFLSNEKSAQYIKKIYDLDPVAFAEKTDSIHKSNLALLANYKKRKHKKNNDSVIDIAHSSINYYNYLKRELYQSARNSENGSSNTAPIPDDFLAHRKHIDFNNKKLRYYYPYFRCINQYMDNLAFDQYKNPEKFSRKKFEHAWHKLDVISKTEILESLKNTLSFIATRNYLKNSKLESNEKKLVEKFLQVNTNPGQHKEVKRLLAVSIKQLPGKHIPNLEIVNTKKETLFVDDLIEKPTVFYFWSYNSFKRNKDLHTKALELTAKYPEYNFIAINVNKDFEKWKTSVSSFNYNVFKEYQLANVHDADHQIIYNGYGKSIIVDQSGNILCSNANLSSVEIEKELLGYLNK